MLQHTSIIYRYLYPLGWDEGESARSRLAKLWCDDAEERKMLIEIGKEIEKGASRCLDEKQERDEFCGRMCTRWNWSMGLHSRRTQLPRLGILVRLLHLLPEMSDA